MASPIRNPDGSIPPGFDPNRDFGATLPIQNPIEHLYKTELGRAPDAEGLSNWTNLYNTGMSLDDIRQQIGGSDEGQRFDINSLYRDELGREADTGGFNAWLGQLQGGMSLDDIRNQGFRGSEEYKKRTASLAEEKNPFDPITEMHKRFGGSPTNPFLGLPMPYDPTFMTTDEDMRPTTTKSRRSFPSGLGVLGSLFGRFSR